MSEMNVPFAEDLPLPEDDPTLDGPPMPGDFGADVPDVQVELPPPPSEGDGEPSNEPPPAPPTDTESGLPPALPTDTGDVVADEALAEAPMPPVTGDTTTAPPTDSTPVEGGEPVAPDTNPGTGDNVMAPGQPTGPGGGDVAPADNAPMPPITGDTTTAPPTDNSPGDGEEPVEPDGDRGTGDNVIGDGQPGGPETAQTETPQTEAPQTEAPQTEAPQDVVATAIDDPQKEAVVEALAPNAPAAEAAAAMDNCPEIGDLLKNLGYLLSEAQSGDAAAAVSGASADRPVILIDRTGGESGGMYRVDGVSGNEAMVVPLSGAGAATPLPLDALAAAATGVAEYEQGPSTAQALGVLAAGVLVVGIGGGVAGALGYKYAANR